ncbi:hypothetical protein DRQ33_07325 [bacterium]|nr:MAG: hypothetical protein DRQ33_07325 [bacterium]
MQESILTSLRDEAKEWCRGRIPYLRIILLIYFTYVGIRHLGNPMYNSWFKPLNLGIHECGHFAFIWMGQFLYMAGGTILQLLVPIVSIGMFYKQSDFFAIAVCFGWLSTNFFDVATYVADARDMSLPLVSPFGAEIMHDWNYLLGRMHLLQYDATIAFLVRCCAVISMLICLIFGTWLIWQMFTSSEED